MRDTSSYLPLKKLKSTRAAFAAVALFAVAFLSPALTTPVAAQALVDITSPSDPVTAVTGYGDGDWNDSGSPSGEQVQNAIDNSGNKYLNFADLYSGFEVVPAAGAKVVVGLRIYTANDSEPRDPASYELYGSNDGVNYTLVASGPLNLPSGRNATGVPLSSMSNSQTVTFTNAAAYKRYKLIFPTLKDASSEDSMQIGEVELLAQSGPSPFVVNSLGDAQDSNIGDGSCATSAGVCTLRAALQEANFNTTNADTITFSVTGAINLSSALPGIAGPLTISGPGASSVTVRRNVTPVTANPAFRIFVVNSGVTATISGITIAGGYSGFSGFGGNIHNSGTLTLADAVVTGGSAYRGGGGIFNAAGTLTVRRSTISNNVANPGDGGGISGGNFTVEDSTITRNHSENDGGGVATDGPATINNSTISGNTSNRACAGMGAPANATLTNVTITNNHADNDNNGSGWAGGYCSNSGSGNGLRNTIVAGNFRGPGTSIPDDMSGNAFNSDYSLIGTGGGVGGSHTLNGISNAMLGPLADNGGPTQTHVLLSGSPALGVGFGYGSATDQRGQSRPTGLGSNIGATHGAGIVSDVTPPSITPNVTGTLGNNGWYTSDVGVSWTVTDAESAVSSQTGCGNSSVTADTVGVTFTCSATSAGGNATQSVTIKRDTVAPSVSASPDRPANGAGWYNSDVTVTPSYTDATSGVATSASAITLGEGAGQNVSFTATDAAGNSASQSFGPYNVDKTAPVVSFNAASPAANSAGWNNTDVMIGFSTSDNLSGVASASKSSPLSFTSEGTALSDAVMVTDLAGNSRSYTSPAVKIDKTAPALNPAAATAPNAAGWYNANFQIKTNATDSLSGIDSSTPDQTFSTEGANQTVTVTATDAAGNTASVQLTGINLDKTAPTLAPARAAGSAANGNGWNNSDVTVAAHAADALSGLASPVANQTVGTEGLNQSVSFTATDVAGNTASASLAGINVDKTAPTLGAQRDTAANGFGWNKTDVSASYTASDSGSGLDSPAAGSYLFNAEGAGQSHTFSVTDKAGNTATVSVSGVNIDKTAPVITINTPQGGAGYLLGQSVTASYTCADALAGNDLCTGTAANNGAVATDVVGLKNFTVQAQDKAGNTASQTNSYTVSFGGAALYDATKAIKAGSTFPVKLQLTSADGSNISSAGLVVTAVGTVRLSDYAPGSVDDAGNANPDMNFRYDPTVGGTGGYIFNFKTTGYATGTYALIYKVAGDPVTHALQFQIK